MTSWKMLKRKRQTWPLRRLRPGKKRKNFTRNDVVVSGHKIQYTNQTAELSKQPHSTESVIAPQPQKYTSTAIFFTPEQIAQLKIQMQHV